MQPVERQKAKSPKNIVNVNKSVTPQTYSKTRVAANLPKSSSSNGNKKENSNVSHNNNNNKNQNNSKKVVG